MKLALCKIMQKYSVEPTPENLTPSKKVPITPGWTLKPSQPQIRFVPRKK
jgi:hypothetical protein